jgi:hypothetical protein
MFKIRSDPRLSNPNPIRVLIKNSDPIRRIRLSPIRSDYETTLSIQSEINIFVPKSEQIRSDRIRIGFAHAPLVATVATSAAQAGVFYA